LLHLAGMPRRVLLAIPLVVILLGQVSACVTDYALACAVQNGCPELYPRTYVVLQGHVLQSGPLGTQQPVQLTRVALQRSGREIAAATTDRTGQYKFTQDIPEGSYDLVLDSSRHLGASRVVLKGSAQTVDILAVAR
jgi:hypothetical protein